MLSVVRPDVGDPPEQPIGVPAVPQESTGACRCDTESWPVTDGKMSRPVTDGEILVVRVSGELDTMTRPVVATALSEALSRGPRHLVVDLAATTFCCLRGYQLLAETGLLAAGWGIGFAVSGLSVHQHRVADLVLPGPVRYRSVAAAVTTIRAGQNPTAC